MKAYLSLLWAIVAPSLADEIWARGGGGGDGWGGGGGGGWGTTTEIIYTTSKLLNINFHFHRTFSRGLSTTLYLSA